MRFILSGVTGLAWGDNEVRNMMHPGSINDMTSRDFPLLRYLLGPTISTRKILELFRTERKRCSNDKEAQLESLQDRHRSPDEVEEQGDRRG